MQKDIVIELNHFCDKACKHCGSYATLSEEYDNSSMTLNTIEKILEQIIWTNKNRHMAKIKTIHLTGGEPFMWQDNKHKIGDAINKILKYGLEPQILTSGTISSDKGFKRYIGGVESISKLKPFDVFHSFNLYMRGTDIVNRLKYSIPLFDRVIGSERELGFFGVYDRSNRKKTLEKLEILMKEFGFKFLKSKSTSNLEEKSRKGMWVILRYRNGKRTAEAEFSQIDTCAGRAREFNLPHIRINKKCYLFEDYGGIQTVIGYKGNVYPCWAGPYFDTRALGNIHKDRLATILGREDAYLRAFKDCIKVDYDGKKDICQFCIDISKDCLNYQFKKDN